MKRRTRYLFIALGFLVFGIVSPLIVLYVSGISYDWNTDQLSATGLLSVRTLPSKAKIYLDGEEQGTTPATLRFLKAKDYLVTVKKEGYFDWSKRLQLKAGQVTWASANLQELHLIRNDAAPVIVSAKVRDYFAGSDYTLYLTDSSLVQTKFGHTEAVKTIKLSSACVSLSASPTQNYVLLSCGGKSLLYKAADLTLIALPLQANTAYTFGPDDSLYSLEKGTLYRTEISNGKRIQVGTSVSAFTFQQGSLYRVQTSGNGSQLVISPLYSPDQTQVLLDNIPAFQTSELYVARSKEIFLLADHVLYRVNDSLDEIQGGVTQVGFDAGAPALAYTTGFELYDYDFSKGASQLILRDAGSLSLPQGIADLGFVLFANGNKIEAAEVDTRDHVNTYVLANPGEIKKYTSDPGHNLVYFLDGTTLKFFQLK